MTSPMRRVNELVSADIGNYLTNKKTWNIYYNVKDFGAKGDGKKDDTSAIQSAQAAATKAGGGIVFFPPGRYMITGSNYLSVKSGSVIWEGVPGESVLDFTNRSGYFDTAVTTGGMIQIHGSLQQQSMLTNNFATGSKQLSVPSTAGYKPGDLLLIASNDNTPFPGDVTPPDVGQLSTIYSIDSATQITLEEPAYNDYNTAQNGRINKVDSIPVTIHGLTFIGQGRPVTGAGDLGLELTYCRNVTITQCTFDDIDQMQLIFRSCYDFTVKDCEFIHSQYNVNGNNNVQYQIRAECASSYGIIQNCRGTHGRHFFNPGFIPSGPWPGIVRFITVTNCQSRNTWSTAYATHNSSEYLTFDHCFAINCVAGFNPRERNIKIVNCTTKDCNIGVFLSKRPQKVEIKNNDFTGGSSGISMPDADLDPGFVTSDIGIIGNKINGTSQVGIFLQNTTASSLCKGINISNNQIANVAGTGNFASIRINGKFSGSIVENVIHNVSSLGIRLEGSTRRLLISKNHIDATGNRSLNISASSCEETIVTDNLFSNYTTSAILDVGTKTIMSGNVDLSGAI